MLKSKKPKIIIISLLFLIAFFCITPARAAATSTPNAVNPDSDHDGLSDKWEKIIGTDPHNPDSDHDGYKDGLEVTTGHDPLTTSTEKIEKRIEVNTKKLEMRYYFGNKLLEIVPVSTGKKSTPTPHGNFTILKKIPIKEYKGKGYDYPNTKWNMLFTSDGGTKNYYIHGAYWHNKFGKFPVSGGCVNVPYANMELLYDFAEVGTKVKVF